MGSILSRQFTSEAKSLLDFINARTQLTEEVREAVRQRCKVIEGERGESVLSEGQVCHRIYFIDEGSARTCYDFDGKEVTSWIYREGQMVTSWGSFYTRMPSHERIELSENSRLTSISYDDLQALYKQHAKMQEFGRLLAQEQIIFLDYFFKGFMFMTAKEKYDLLLSVFPDVTQRVNLGHIASFLGITQETLSRIRKR